MRKPQCEERACYKVPVMSLSVSVHLLFLFVYTCFGSPDILPFPISISSQTAFSKFHQTFQLYPWWLPAVFSFQFPVTEIIEFNRLILVTEPEVNHISDHRKEQNLWMCWLWYLFVFVLFLSQFLGFLFILFIHFFLLFIPVDARFGQNKLRRRYFLWSQFNRNYVLFMLIYLIQLTQNRKKFMWKRQKASIA